MGRDFCCLRCNGVAKCSTPKLDRASHPSPAHFPRSPIFGSLSTSKVIISRFLLCNRIENEDVCKKRYVASAPVVGTNYKPGTEPNEIGVRFKRVPMTFHTGPGPMSISFNLVEVNFSANLPSVSRALLRLSPPLPPRMGSFISPLANTWSTGRLIILESGP